MTNSKGHIVLIGGAEDKTDRREVLEYVVRLNSVRHVLVIPTASQYPKELFADYTSAFRALGAGHVDLLDIRYRHEADNPAYLELVEAADLVFFTGGDQENLVRILDRTHLLTKIRAAHENGKTIAGTSAGASALGNPMIVGGNGNKGFRKSNVRKMSGFGFLDGFTIDTHFMERGRIPRLTQIVSAGLSKLGIGLGENTGTIMFPDDRFQVIGSGVVVVLNGD